MTRLQARIPPSLAERRLERWQNRLLRRRSIAVRALFWPARAAAKLRLQCFEGSIAALLFIAHRRLRQAHPAGRTRFGAPEME